VRSLSEVGADNGFVVTSTTSTRAAVGPTAPKTLTNEWWTLSERLTSVAQAVAGVELTASTRKALVEITVELFVLLTCWPGSPKRTNPLAYRWGRRRGTRAGSIRCRGQPGRFCLVRPGVPHWWPPQ
jgi:hypothetical protein